MLTAAVTGVEGEAAQSVKNRLALVDLHRQRVVRAVPDDDVGAGIYGGMGYLRHVVEHFLVQAPVVRGHHYVGAFAQSLHIRPVLREIVAVRPGHDDWRYAWPVGRWNVSPGLVQRQLISRDPAQ